MTPGGYERSVDPDVARLLVQPSNQSIATHTIDPQAEPMMQHESHPQGLSDVFGHWPNWPNE